ncbi:MAG: DUF3990 domain-containing protein [Bacteroidales bacterium]|jgi:hypothetical protein|nr:DUF3990 domain-containing protein [Bacteroidales bacterium]
MKVYHGSYLPIEEVDLSQSNFKRDFGRGFYVTKFKQQAEYWAERIGREHKTGGFVTEFEFDEFVFEDKDLQVLRFDCYDDKWLDFIVLNRKTKTSSHQYDIVEGPVADDKITSRIFAYLKNEISRKDFLKELTYHAPTHQICLCTVKSLSSIEKIDHKQIYSIEQISEAVIEHLMIDFSVKEEDAVELFYNSKVFSILADEKTAFYTKSWQEIYSILRVELEK